MICLDDDETPERDLTTTGKGSVYACLCGERCCDTLHLIYMGFNGTDVSLSH